MTSTVTRSQSNRAPLGCGGTGDLHHGCAADKSVYIEPHSSLNTSCISKYHVFLGKKAVKMNVSAGVEASRVLSCILFILFSLLHPLFSFSPIFLFAPPPNDSPSHCLPEIISWLLKNNFKSKSARGMNNFGVNCTMEVD
ncbi:hypothetical protein GOODEAATRI_021227 [Goodea atripinnis]|uniref:Uncharacterized protein n=1 Tax=Goodea atripinnis TaxID=208336 RepID=A0ABV0P6M6_9TELE